MLIDGEIDAFLCEELVVRDILFETFPDDFERIRMIPDVGEHRELRLVAPKRQASFIEEFDAAFASQTAAIQQIHRRYRRDKGVVLRGFPGEPLIVGRRGPDGQRPGPGAAVAAIPHGTKATVLDWGDAFSVLGGRTPEDVGRGESRLLIRSGPLKGEELWVRAPFIQLDSR